MGEIIERRGSSRGRRDYDVDTFTHFQKYLEGIERATADRTAKREKEFVELRDLVVQIQKTIDESNCKHQVEAIWRFVHVLGVVCICVFVLILWNTGLTPFPKDAAQLAGGLISATVLGGLCLRYIKHGFSGFFGKK